VFSYSILSFHVVEIISNDKEKVNIFFYVWRTSPPLKKAYIMMKALLCHSKGGKTPHCMSNLVTFIDQQLLLKPPLP